LILSHIEIYYFLDEACEGDVPEVPHRPVRRAPLFHRGSNKSLHGVTRLYMDEDGWEKSCREMEWVDAPPERHFPFYRTPAGRRCFFILHLFAGRRRLGDYHDELLRFASTEEFDVKVLSFDTAIHQQLGDLSANSASWSKIAALVKGGYISGAIAGPPCETFTEARNHIPEGVTEEERKRWPRPLRDAAAPWGLDHLTCREMRQLKVGSGFALQMLWIFAMLLAMGGHMLMEHPAPPKDPKRVSIFRLHGYHGFVAQAPGIPAQGRPSKRLGCTGCEADRFPYFESSHFYFVDEKVDETECLHYTSDWKS